AAFFAEMMMPMAANPVYLTAPVFWVMVFSTWYSVGASIIAALLVGLPLAVAASCTSKTTEIVCMLRLAPRTRGAVLGILSWLGYATLVVAAMSISLVTQPGFLVSLIRPLQSMFGGWHLPLFGWAIGIDGGGNMMLSRAVLAGWLFSA